MKRCLSLLLSLFLILSLFGCELKPVNGSESENSQSGNLSDGLLASESVLSDTAAKDESSSKNVSSATLSKGAGSALNSDAATKEKTATGKSGTAFTGASSAGGASSATGAGSGSGTKNSSEYVRTAAKASEMRAVWYSYIELNFSGLSYNDFTKKIDEMFDRAKSLSMNAVICQVRANADAYYPSAYFPFSASVTGTAGKAPDYDPLKYMVSAAHKKGLQFHAWINPYRVTAAHNNIKKLPKDSPAVKWAQSDNKKTRQNVLYTKSGIYFNPASPQVRQLIVNGVREILKNYAVDGIQFDDYFYPTTDKSFDEKSYSAYSKGNSDPLPLAEWRRTNVSVLVADVYEAVHKKKNVVFGIAPAAAVSKDKTDANYTVYYADIYRWMAEPCYIDYIAPQLYYGYRYKKEAFQFKNLLSLWTGVRRAKAVKLYIGLAPYKIGTEDAGSKEWITDKNILAREVTDLRRQKAVSGFMMYSYSYLFKDSPRHRSELAALKKVL